MKKISKKNLYIIIGVAVVIIVVILIAVFSNRQNPVNNNVNATPLNEQNAQNENAPSESNTSMPTSTSTSAPTPDLSYGEALKMYENRRFQFSFNDINNCIMTPSSSVFKKGTKVMLDNRVNKQITVYFDGTAYNLKAYGFRIITLTTSAQLPHTIKVDCGTGKNNGQILLQQ
jgi:hypothetical protein